ncbi:uncharacterized protein SCHCODRAFT_02615840 [Schizophyllum commune H4-8]|nr:uncharacterized protein SCHCODRAFT_02615840 [Schizophyllum commune H4-8]KAI5896793.1 hypothetical protein SCHCODRAFT_02615840 [Schizophyllum commune H4-8]
MQSVEAALNDARAIANARLHRTPFVPADQDSVIMRDMAQKLRDLGDEIDVQIQKLKGQRSAVNAQLEMHDALLSPHRRLPPEIWSEIFFLALPDDWEHRSASRRVLHSARVCVMWRSIALSTPRLWTTLVFDTTKSPLAKHVNSVAQVLDRTAQASLDLTVSMAIPFTSSARPQKYWSNDAWSILCSQSHRWSRLSLDSIPFEAYLSLASHSFPLLRSLSIALDHCDDNDPAAEVPLDVFRNAQGVQALHVRYYTEPPTLVLPPSWTITEFTITCGDYPGDGKEPSVQPCMGALVACSGTLRKLTISADCVGTLPNSLMTFPVLENLRLDGDDVSVCSAISAPRLRVVTLASDGLVEFTPDVLQSLETLSRNSLGCKALRSLALLNIMGLDPSAFVACLHHFPQLTELKLSHPEDTEIDDDSPLSFEMLVTLSRDNGEYDSLTFLPNLQHLHLIFNGMVYIDDVDSDFGELIWEIVRSREHPRVVEGAALGRLEKLITDVGTLSYP